MDTPAGDGSICVCGSDRHLL